ncbi:hypothetical protein [Microvirga sp. TS319]|uniref:hypothetical protein n=1 Tax=Microvirga sp. TS319 TaxID=3241165 RepID=UPI00351A083F
MTFPDKRQPTVLEKAIIERLLIDAIPEVEFLKEQLSSCHVRVIDEFGSLMIQPAEGAPIWPLDYSGPLVTAYQADFHTTDIGPFINFILFVERGVMKELQIYRDDGARPNVTYDPKKFALVTTSMPRL